MDFITTQPSLKNFTIPRKNAESLESLKAKSSTPNIFPVIIDSELFQKSYGSIFMAQLSPNCNSKEVKIRECLGISNKILEKKFNNFRKQLEDSSLPSEVSYGFMVLDNAFRQAEEIAEHGLKVGNFVLGEVGNAEKGVCLIENPDLVVPSAFFETTTLRIMCFKVLKGRSRVVDLGSQKVEPCCGYNSHIAPPVKSRKLSRYVMYRFSQIYLFESLSSGKLSKVPSGILPYAIFTVEFPPTALAKSNHKLISVWNGSLKSGPQIFHNLHLSSTGGVLLKPPSLLSELQIPALVDWTTCLQFPFIQELLSPSLVGDLGIKKELFLINGKQFVSYYVLSAAQENSTFTKFIELTQVHQVVGYQVLDSDARVLLIPNGSLSLALGLPYKTDPIFHCLHISKESSIIGMHKPLSERENASLNRDPLCMERLDGLNHHVQKVIKKIRDSCEKEASEGTADASDAVSKVEIVKKTLTTEKPKKSVEENFENVDMDIDDVNTPSTTGVENNCTDSDNKQVVVQKPTKFRKTKVITSTSLLDPRLSISEYFKKRKAQEANGNVPKASEGVVKKTKSEEDNLQNDLEMELVEAKERISVSEIPTASYAYQAPLPQVALVIEKMKDRTESDSHANLPGKTFTSDTQKELGSNDATVTLNSNTPNKSNDGRASWLCIGNMQNETATSSNSRELPKSTIEGLDVRNQKTAEIDEIGDVDLRVMQLSEAKLEKILSNLRVHCQDVKDSEFQYFLNHSNFRNVDISEKKVEFISNSSHSTVLHTPGIIPLSSATEKNINESLCRVTSVKESRKPVLESRLTFVPYSSSGLELRNKKDIDYRLSETSTRLITPLTGNTISCNSSLSFDPALTRKVMSDIVKRAIANAGKPE